MIEVQLTGPQWYKVVECMNPCILSQYINGMVDYPEDRPQGVDFTNNEVEVIYDALDALGMLPDGEYD